MVDVGSGRLLRTMSEHGRTVQFWLGSEGHGALVGKVCDAVDNLADASERAGVLLQSLEDASPGDRWALCSLASELDGSVSRCVPTGIALDAVSVVDFADEFSSGGVAVGSDDVELRGAMDEVIRSCGTLAEFSRAITHNASVALFGECTRDARTALRGVCATLTNPDRDSISPREIGILRDTVRDVVESDFSVAGECARDLGNLVDRVRAMQGDGARSSLDYALSVIDARAERDFGSTTTVREAIADVGEFESVSANLRNADEFEVTLQCARRADVGAGRESYGPDDLHMVLSVRDGDLDEVGAFVLNEDERALVLNDVRWLDDEVMMGRFMDMHARAAEQGRLEDMSRRTVEQLFCEVMDDNRVSEHGVGRRPAMRSVLSQRRDFSGFSVEVRESDPLSHPWRSSEQILGNFDVGQFDFSDDPLPEGDLSMDDDGFVLVEDDSYAGDSGSADRSHKVRDDGVSRGGIGSVMDDLRVGMEGLGYGRREPSVDVEGPGRVEPQFLYVPDDVGCPEGEQVSYDDASMPF